MASEDKRDSREVSLDFLKVKSDKVGGKKKDKKGKKKDITRKILDFLRETPPPAPSERLGGKVSE